MVTIILAIIFFALAGIYDNAFCLGLGLGFLAITIFVTVKNGRNKL